ncbi:hypothetical protein H257_13426 [Aphanomyces astaci]|uniref:Uncharacterized protein n=1 Tax=Aphanomyces astaci TaxID=112090 RepID=W4FWW7_APHAT|nr:hypothetical protein H257_13426 [Aphanomyces astaci]ETV71294.1 hypothetical protein H257_13426 [Aphanomyces astaci]|eukprot:XP_009839234.1 hypothetical protein H257_13426 [Aphanomyces astaci]
MATHCSCAVGGAGTSSSGSPRLRSCCRRSAMNDDTAAFLAKASVLSTRSSKFKPGYSSYAHSLYAVMSSRNASPSFPCVTARLKWVGNVEYTKDNPRGPSKCCSEKVARFFVTLSGAGSSSLFSSSRGASSSVISNARSLFFDALSP